MPATCAYSSGILLLGKQKGNDIDGEAYGDNSGWSVSISADGNTLAVGARGNGGDSQVQCRCRSCACVPLV